MPTTPGQQELLDIPGGTRNALILTGVAGLIVTIVASLEGGSGTTLEVDKILHFLGYAALAMVFVLALKPKIYLPALLGLMATAGGEGQPVSIVLRSLADTVKSLAEDVLANRRTKPVTDRRV